MTTSLTTTQSGRPATELRSPGSWRSPSSGSSSTATTWWSTAPSSRRSCATPARSERSPRRWAGCWAATRWSACWSAPCSPARVGDILGRRKVMLMSYAWFSVGMAFTALMTTTSGFGLMRFVTGLGVGALVATTGAIVSEFAPPGKKNLCNAITYSGVPFGSLLAALLAIILLRPSAGGACSGSGRCRWSRCCRWPSSRCPSRRPGCCRAAGSRRPARSRSGPACR